MYLVSFLLRANNCLGDSFFAAAKEPGNAEIGYLGDHIAVKENVCCLEISMNNVEPGVLVKVENASSNPEDDIKPRIPVQSLSASRICLQIYLQN